MDWDYWLGKHVFIRLKKGDCYNGVVISIGDGFVSILDKYDERVMLSLSEISKIKEEENKKYGGN